MNLTIAVAIILTVSITNTVFGCQIDMSAYRQGALNEHNKLRAKHGTPPLTLDNDLNNRAQAYADELRTLGDSGANVLVHHPWAVNLPGENLHYSCAYKPKRMYTKESALWTYGNDNPVTNAASHFTQIVWKNQCKMGVGVGFYKQCKCHVVVYYFDGPERANMGGRYTENVPRVGSALSANNCTGGSNVGSTGGNTAIGGNTASNGNGNTNNGQSSNGANSGSEAPLCATGAKQNTAGLKNFCGFGDTRNLCPKTCSGV